MTTPLHLLLDGILSNDYEQVNEAVNYVANSQPSSMTPAQHSKLVSIMLQARSSTNTITNIVQFILQRDPDMASVKSAVDKSLPLHFAATLGNKDVAAMLIKAYPQGVLAANEKGKLPIHYAAREGRVDVVDLLLQADPSCAKVTSHKQKLALHFSVGDGHREVSLKLLRAYPEAAMMKSQKGRLALHFACRWGHNKLVQDLLEIYPQAARCLDWDGSLPLHDAARQGQVETAKILLKAYPQGIKQINHRDETPLFAAARAPSLECVEVLVRAWPAGGRSVVQKLRPEDGIDNWDWKILELCLRGATNMLPPMSDFDQHHESDHPHDNNFLTENFSNYAECKKPAQTNAQQDECRKRTGSLTGEYKRPSKKVKALDADENVNYNFRNSPKSYTHHKKFKALHAALESHASYTVLRRVLQLYSHQVFDVDHKNQTALHVAVQYLNNETLDKMSHEKIVKEIIRLNPQSALKRDLNLRLPLHSALCAKPPCPAELMKLLIDVNKSSAYEKCGSRDCFNEKEPLFMAMANDCDLETVFMFIRGNPSVLDEQTSSFLAVLEEK